MTAASRLLLVAAALLAAAGVHAESWVLRGNVGKYPIVMQLDDDSGDAFGAYFYDKYKQDIPLRGHLEGQVYRLSSAVFDADEKGADHFALTRSADGVKGSFTSAKGVALPVELHRVAAGSVASPRADLHFSKPLGDYENLRLSGIGFVPGKKETVGGQYGIQWITEPRSKIAMFHVVSGYPEAVMAKINAVIDRDFYEGLSGYFGCSDGQGGSGSESVDVSHYYLSDRFVSYSVSSSWSCAGAAHPDFGEIGTTIDARTGQELTLEDVYWVGKGARPAPHSDAWMQYRSKVFAPAIVQLFTKLYPQDMKSSDDEDGCRYADPDIWDFGPWYLTDKGLYVGAYFARVARSCDNPDWSIIPYSLLKKNNPALFEH